MDELVKAIKNDLKTETRRILRLPMGWSVPPAQYHDGFVNRWGADPGERIACPYGKAGEFLWVRERFVAMKYDLTVCKIGEADGVAFRDGSTKWKDGKTRSIGELPGRWNGRTWRPPMHLPFWGFRIGLEVTSIGIERVQDITEAGAVAEGFQTVEPLKDCPQCGGRGVYLVNSMGAVFDADCMACDTARGRFCIKWDVINGKRIDRSSGTFLTWEANPLVWVVKFRKISDPIQVG